MSAFLGPKISTDGLVLSLDPSNPRSYPGTGTDLFDLSGNSNHATLYGGLGVTQNYLAFDGTDDYVEFPTLTVSKTAGFWSIWVYVDDFTTFTADREYDPRILVRGESGYNRVLALYNGGFGYETNTNSNPNDIASNQSPGDFPHSEIAPGKWFQFAMNSTNDTVSTYIDGELKRSFTVADDLELRYIGRQQPPTNYPDWLKGRIGNFMIYDRSLSPNEIKNNYDAFVNRYV